MSNQKHLKKFQKCFTLHGNIYSCTYVNLPKILDTKRAISRWKINCTSEPWFSNKLKTPLYLPLTVSLYSALFVHCNSTPSDTSAKFKRNWISVIQIYKQRHSAVQAQTPPPRSLNRCNTHQYWASFKQNRSRIVNLYPSTPLDLHSKLAF